MTTHKEAPQASTTFTGGGIAALFGTKWAPLLEAPGEGNGGNAGPTEAEKAAAAEKAAKDAADKVESDKNKPSDVEAQLLKEQMKTKRKLDDANALLKAAEAKLKDYEGIDPAKARELEKAAKDAEVVAAEAKGDFDRVKQMMRDEHAKEIEAVKKEVTERDTRLTAAQTQIADLTVGQAFRDSEYVKGDMVYTPAKAQKLFGEHFSFEDGVVVGYDKPVGRKTRTMLVDAGGNPLPFDAAIKKLVEADPEKDSILRSKVVDGAGSKTADGKAPVKVAAGIHGKSRIAAALAAQKR